MPDISYLILKWWKQMLFVILLSLAVIAAIVYLQPSRYLSVSTAIAANSNFADKARIFNKNIEMLYTNIGSPDELDVILGTAKLDTVYIAITMEYNLWDHYKMKKNGWDDIYKTAAILKKNTRVIKSEYGELKVKVWDKSRSMAAVLANAIMSRLNAIHSKLQNESNRATLDGLLAEKQKLSIQIDSLTTTSMHIEDANARLKEYEGLIEEYQIIVNAKAPALMIVENARPALRPDRPKIIVILIATAFLAFLFALLVIVLIEKRKTMV